MESYCEFIDCSHAAFNHEYFALMTCICVHCKKTFCRKHMVRTLYAHNDTLCDKNCTGTHSNYKCVCCAILTIEMQPIHAKCYIITVHMPYEPHTKLTIEDLKKIQSMPMQLTKAVIS